MALAMMLGLLCTNPCEAVFSEILYGVESGTDGLSVYDPVTGDANFIGELDGDPLVNNFSTPIAMAVRPSDGTIFVWNNSSGSPPGPWELTYELLTVDPATGLATEVDPLASPQGQLGALVFTPDGRLFGLDHTSETLVEIDPATGLFVVGSTVDLGLGITAADSDACGVIYGVELNGGAERFVTIDPTTGAVTDINDLNPEVGVIGSIVFDPDGNLIGSSFGGSLGKVLFDIDLATGAVSNIRSTQTASQGLGFVFAYSQEETPEGEDVIVRLHDTRKKVKKKAVRVKFKKVKKAGTTTFKKKAAKKKKKEASELSLLQFAVCSPSNVIEIETTAEFDPPVEVCVDYTDITCDGSDLRLLHKAEDGSWEDVTTCIDVDPDLTTCGDPDTLDVCGEVEDLSDFAVLVKKADADEDGLPDEDEDFYGTDWLDPDTDDDGLLDGTEVEMAEGSGCPNPTVDDSDSDTLADGDEVLNIGTNPCSSDSDEDGVPDNIDPNPLEPGEVSDELEAAVRNLASLIADLDPGLFSGPNYNANKGRRNSLATRVRNAANAISKDDFSSAIDLLTGVLEKIDGEEPPRDWMSESLQKTTTAAFVSQLIGLLTM